MHPVSVFLDPSGIFASQHRLLSLHIDPDGKHAIAISGAFVGGDMSTAFVGGDISDEIGIAGHWHAAMNTANRITKLAELFIVILIKSRKHNLLAWTISVMISSLLLF